MAVVEKHPNQESYLAMARAGSITSGKMFVLSNLRFQFCKTKKLDQPSVFKAFFVLQPNIYVPSIYIHIQI